MIEPLRVQIDLGCPPDHAFVTWAERFGQGWPPGQTVTRGPAGIRLEPLGLVGGAQPEEQPPAAR